MVNIRYTQIKNTPLHRWTFCQINLGGGEYKSKTFNPKNDENSLYRTFLIAGLRTISMLVPPTVSFIFLETASTDATSSSDTWRSIFTVGWLSPVLVNFVGVSVFTTSSQFEDEDDFLGETFSSLLGLTSFVGDFFSVLWPAPMFYELKLILLFKYLQQKIQVLNSSLLRNCGQNSTSRQICVKTELRPATDLTEVVWNRLFRLVPFHFL